MQPIKTFIKQSKRLSKKNKTLLKRIIKEDYQPPKRYKWKQQIQEQVKSGCIPSTLFEKTFGYNPDFLQLSKNVHRPLKNEEIRVGVFEPLDYITQLCFEFYPHNSMLYVLKKTKIINGNIERLTLHDQKKQHAFYSQNQHQTFDLGDNSDVGALGFVNYVDKPHVYIYSYDSIFVKRRANIDFLRTVFDVPISENIIEGHRRIEFDDDMAKDLSVYEYSTFFASDSSIITDEGLAQFVWGPKDGYRYIYSKGRREFYYEVLPDNLVHLEVDSDLETNKGYLPYDEYSWSWLSAQTVMKYSGYVFSAELNKFIYMYNNLPCEYSKNLYRDIRYFDFNKFRLEKAYIGKQVCVCQRCMQDAIYVYGDNYGRPTRNFIYRDKVEDDDIY